MKKDRKDKENLPPEQPYTGRTYAYIAVVLCFACALFFGLAFTVMGIYSLIASILLSLASLSFVNVQKRKNNFKNLIYVKVCAYILLAICAGFFIGGIIWSAVK